jgi:hypothetical protein
MDICELDEMTGLEFQVGGRLVPEARPVKSVFSQPVVQPNLSVKFNQTSPSTDESAMRIIETLQILMMAVSPCDRMRSRKGGLSIGGLNLPCDAIMDAVRISGRATSREDRERLTDALLDRLSQVMRQMTPSWDVTFYLSFRNTTDFQSIILFLQRCAVEIQRQLRAEHILDRSAPRPTTHPTRIEVLAQDQDRFPTQHFRGEITESSPDDVVLQWWATGGTITGFPRNHRLVYPTAVD